MLWLVAPTWFVASLAKKDLQLQGQVITYIDNFIRRTNAPQTSSQHIVGVQKPASFALTKPLDPTFG